MDVRKQMSKSKIEKWDDGRKEDQNDYVDADLSCNPASHIKSSTEDDSTMNSEEGERRRNNATCSSNKNNGEDNCGRARTNAIALNTVTGSLSTSSLIFDWQIPYIRRDQRQKLTSPSTRLKSNDGINSSVWSLQLSCDEETNGESWLSVFLWLRQIFKWPNIHSDGQCINYRIYLLNESGDVLFDKESGIRYLKETSAVGWKKYAPLSSVFSPNDFLSSGFTVRLELTALQGRIERHFPVAEIQVRDSAEDGKENKLQLNSDDNVFQVLCDRVTFCMQEEIDKGNVPPRCAIVCGSEIRVMSATLVAAHSPKLAKMIMDQYQIQLDETNSVRIRSSHTNTPGVTAIIPKIILTDVSQPPFKRIMNFISTNEISLADHDIDFHEICKLMKTACFYHIWILARKCLLYMIESWLSVDTVSIIALISELLPARIGLDLEDEKTQVKQYFQKNWELVRESISFRSNIAHETNKKVFANLLFLQ